MNIVVTMTSAGVGGLAAVPDAGAYADGKGDNGKELAELAF